MLKGDPTSYTPAASPADVDDWCFLQGKTESWSRFNSRLLLCGLRSQIQEQGLNKDEGLIQVPVVLETIQRMHVLLGNANHLLSEKRRLSIQGQIH